MNSRDPDDPTNSDYRGAEQRQARDSVNASLKQIISIVMGLALTNTVVALITAGHYDDIHKLSHLPLPDVAYSLVLVITMIRFYHGNLRHFEHVHGTAAVQERYARGQTPGRMTLGVDFMVIFGESVLFAVASFYAQRETDYLVPIIILLILDIGWFIFNLSDAHAREAAGHQRGWLLNNFFAVLIIGFFYFSAKDSGMNLYLDLAAGTLAVNTLIDFAISWDFYFPYLGKESLLS